MKTVKMNNRFRTFSTRPVNIVGDLVNSRVMMPLLEFEGKLKA